MHLTARERRLIALKATDRVSHVARARVMRKAVAKLRAADDIAARKGKLHGKCNVTACTERGDDVRWWNRPMGAYYCTHCKDEISRFDEHLGTERAIFEVKPHTSDEER